MTAPPATLSREFLSKKVSSVLMMLSINALTGKSHFAVLNGVLETSSATQRVRHRLDHKNDVLICNKIIFLSIFNLFLGFEWTDWMNNDHPENGLSTGDWETINSFGERSVCGNPTGVQAYPIDRNAGSTAVTHIGRFKRFSNTVTPFHCDVTPSFTGVTGISAARGF